MVIGLTSPEDLEWLTIAFVMALVSYLELTRELHWTTGNEGGETVERKQTLRNRSHDETLGAWWKVIHPFFFLFLHVGIFSHGVPCSSRARSVATLTSRQIGPHLE